ncbi:MAG: hypothetical protein AB9897_03035 [Anaerolineaceae bacterium]
MNKIISMILLAFLIGCTKSPLDSSGNNSEVEESQPSIEENLGQNTRVVPFLVYTDFDLHFYDFENDKIYQTDGDLVNQKYIYYGGKVKNLITNEVMTSFEKDRCGMYKAEMISEKLVLVYGCYSENNDGNNRIMPIWDMKTGELVTEITVDEDLDNFTDILVSPDNELFLLASPNVCSKIFSTKTFEQIAPTQTQNCNYLTSLSPSANRQYFVSNVHEFTVWKWTPNGIEQIESPFLSDITTKVIDSTTGEVAYYIMGGGPSISNDGNLLAYPDSIESFSIIDLTTGKIAHTVAVENAIGSHQSALSPDNKYLFISNQGGGDETASIFVYDLDQNMLVQKIPSSYENIIIQNLRIEYLPEEILTKWEWIPANAVIN